MKRISFFAWVLLAVATLSFQSCVPGSGDEESTVTQLMIARFDEASITDMCFYDIDGLKVIPEDPSILYTLGTKYGLYQFTAIYDPTTITDKQVTVKLNSEPEYIMNTSSIFSTEAFDGSFTSESLLPLYAVNSPQNNLYPVMFSECYLLVPVMFYGPSIVSDKEREAELKKHAFVISFEEIQPGDTTLKLHLHDVVSDPDTPRGYNYYVNQGFDLKPLIDLFKSEGNKLETISITGKVNAAGADYDTAKDEFPAYTISYKY